jgi:hypothetical protein
VYDEKLVTGNREERLLMSSVVGRNCRCEQVLGLMKGLNQELTDGRTDGRMSAGTSEIKHDTEILLKRKKFHISLANDFIKENYRVLNKMPRSFKMTVFWVVTPCGL